MTMVQALYNQVQSINNKFANDSWTPVQLGNN